MAQRMQLLVHCGRACFSAGGEVVGVACTLIFEAVRDLCSCMKKCLALLLNMKCIIKNCWTIIPKMVVIEISHMHEGMPKFFV